ncbi:MAG: hypothetical protein JWR69_3237 [Pedosphaera sp.]|nr:hypothetical protein [Pedosphaera sp.]
MSGTTYKACARSHPCRYCDLMSFDKAIEAASRDHKALFAIDPQNKPELELALGTLKASLDGLSKEVAERAFQDGRSKRKQWADIQKLIADLLDDGRSYVEREPSAPTDMSAKIDVRYSRMHQRMTKLSDS